MKLTQSLFSISGRINRRQFWLKGGLGALAVVVASVVLYVLTLFLLSLAIEEDLFENDADANFLSQLLWVPFAFLLAYIMVAVFSKRWHDLGRSGTWNTLLFIPIVAFFALPVFVLILGLKRGQPEENAYGPVPK